MNFIIWTAKYAINPPIKKRVEENQNIYFWNFPAILQPLPPVIEQASFPFGFKVIIPLKTNNNPAPKKIQSLFCEIIIKNGNALISETTADPPATAAIDAGNAQQISVAEEPNRLKKLINFSFISVIS